MDANECARLAAWLNAYARRLHTWPFLYKGDWVVAATSLFDDYHYILGTAADPVAELNWAEDDCAKYVRMKRRS